MRTQEQDLLMLCKCICCVSFSKFSVLMVYSLALHRNCVRQFLTYDAITIRYRRQWRRMVKNVVGEAEPAKWQLVPQSPSTPASQPPSLSASQPLSPSASQSFSLPAPQSPSLSAPQPPSPSASQPLSLPASQPPSLSASQSTASSSESKIFQKH